MTFFLVTTVAAIYAVHLYYGHPPVKDNTNITLFFMEREIERERGTQIERERERDTQI